MAQNNQKAVPQRDTYSRLSYLYQLSNSFAASSPIISRSFARNVDSIAKKTVIKLSPSMKRSICKKCNALLLPGLTMKIYIENKSKEKLPKCDILVYLCNTCSKKKRFPVGMNKDYVLFLEKNATDA